MSIQDKISNNFSPLKRKLRDYSVFINGTECKVIRLKTTSNRYGDETIEVISHSTITMMLKIPDEIPLSRLRSSVLDNIAKTDTTFMYDIIPIIGYASFEDNIENGDILILKITTDSTVVDDAPLLWILRVSEVLGSINNRNLTNISFHCSPYMIALPVEVQNIIDSYRW